MKTKIGIFILLTLLLLGLLGIVTAAGLAAFAPFTPGQKPFAFQDWAEHSYQALLSDPESQAQYGVRLLEHRIIDLEDAIGTPVESDALIFVSREIDHILALFEKVPPESEEGFRAMFVQDLDYLLFLLEKATFLKGSSPQVLTDFTAKVLELKVEAEDIARSLGDLSFTGAIKEASTTTARNSSTILVLAEIESQIIPFPKGSPGALHLFYPLDGKHSELSCLSCHVDGNYSGTPNLCSDCHMDSKPVDHYDGQCMLCHSTTAWLPSTFDHQTFGALDCQSCHISVLTANHYPGQCSACHITTAWLPATFGHETAGAFNCQNCHDTARPANHYSGQCSACHTTTAWLPASFDHQAADATDCATCHSNVRPANHFSGQCSACHSTSAWLPASFDHQVAGATDCASCHSNVKPSNHFSGQCSACHSTSAWRPASFNHAAAGATDCQACHSGVRPANHFSGQCSDCHSTSSWTPANFNHTFPTDHGDAAGVCAKCHPSGGSDWTCFTCHDESELTKKHNEEGIPDYVAGCMECHGDGRKHD